MPMRCAAKARQRILVQAAELDAVDLDFALDPAAQGRP